MLLEVGIRVFLGSIFLVSAMGKLSSPRRFVENVSQYRILPDILARFYGWTLPFVELLAASLLLSGFGVRIGAWLVVAMTVSFVFAISIATLQKQNLTCTCFGLLYRERVGWPTLARDLVLLSLAVSLLTVTGSSSSILYMMNQFPSIDATVSLVITMVAISASLAVGILSMKPFQWKRRQTL